MSLEISIIIPSTGSLNNLIRLATSIKKQDCNLEAIEAIFLINGYFPDQAREKIEKSISEILSRSQIFFDHKVGANRARNSGIRTAKSQLLLFLDDDCVLIKKSFLREHVDFHKKNSEVFAIGGGYALPEEPSFFDRVYNYIQMEWYFSGLFDGLERRTRHLLGGNFSAKKDIIFKENLFFDEELIYGGTEYEFFRRAEELGLQLRTIELDLQHNSQVGFFSLSRKLLKQGRGKAIVDLKLPNSIRVYTDDSAQHSARKKLNMSLRMALLFYNYIFWFGYYQQRGGVSTFLKRLFSDLLGLLNYIRYSFFEHNKKQLEEKRKKGDRF